MKKNWLHIFVLATLLVVVLLFYRHQPQVDDSLQDIPNKKAPSPAFLAAIHFTMDIPNEMSATKEGKDFCWMTDNGTSIMRNICVYSYLATRLDTADIIAKRDSVMRENIHGETDDMVMATDRRMPVSHSITPNGRLRTEGTWEMNGDMMGGPFVSHSFLDEANGRVIVAEGFLFAPDRDKATPMKRIEEILLTLRQAP
ncbi:MAG: DUF4837 family protein [Prevotella sp.]|nr:DUF4837 family protein [Prevotella sp.]